MHSITPSEYQALIPFVGLSLVYWWRDRYFFNRGQSITRTQWLVLAFLYPLWSFLEWTNGLQITRRKWYFISFGTIGRTLVAHYTEIAIFNDAFVQTRQQLLSFLVTLFISYMWSVLGVLMFAD